MMPNISKRILAGQTVVDIALQELGDASRAFEVAVLNGISVTDDLVAGETLLVPDFDPSVRSIVRLFSVRALAPASSDILSDAELIDSGIDYDAIELDLIVA